ncbi:MAG: N-acetyltransferase [Chloroflexi bacterium]|nr:MAG: N-acetyltransferase [Chloroflexota bacterium]
MSDCTIVEKLPQPEEYNWLREQVGWRTNPEDVIRKAPPTSLYGVCAYQAGQLVGMARVIGDAGLVYYIQDVIVVPECQRQGIGTQLMDRVMGYIRKHASHNTIVGLMSAKEKEAFYERYGFTVRPTERLGAGMTLFWQ